MINLEDCLKCGWCCWFDRNNFTGKISDIVGKDGFCIHRSENGCKIYENRFEACKALKMGGFTCLQIRNRHNVNK